MSGADGSARNHDSARPRWTPTRFELGRADLPLERLRADGIDVPQRLLGHVTIEQHLAGSMLAGRVLRDVHGADVTVRRDPAGIFVLELAIGEQSLVGFAVVSQSSMEPRPIWPMMLAVAAVEHRPIDWIVACSVPKMFTLDDMGDGPADAYVLGGLPSEELADLPIVDVLPHPGHDFEAKYRQAKNHRLWSLDRLVESLAAGVRDDPPGE